MPYTKQSSTYHKVHFFIDEKLIQADEMYAGCRMVVYSPYKTINCGWKKVKLNHYAFGGHYSPDENILQF